uniref:BTB domain-containing protein n=1 Tax=Caenorhabditis japonica TaxID=281687 RepID=A0A8R1DX27_CAEJA
MWNITQFILVLCAYRYFFIFSNIGCEMSCCERYVKVCPSENKNGTLVSAYLYCDVVDVANWWRVGATFCIVVENEDDDHSIVRQMHHIFERETSPSRGWTIATLDEVSKQENKFVDEDGDVEFRVMIGVDWVEGFSTPKYFDFFSKNGDDDAVKIILDDVTFYVNKYIISGHSSYFRYKLIDGDEVEIDDVKIQDFYDFLQFLYAVPLRISKNNVDRMSQIAIRFNAINLKTWCIEYLEFAHMNKEMTDSEILQVADEHGFADVMKTVIGSAKSASEVKTKFPDYEDYSTDALCVIVRKALSFK